MSWWKKASRKEPQARGPRSFFYYKTKQIHFFLNWGSKAGAFGFTNELPFMGSAWWILVLLVFLILVALCYLAITNLIRRKLDRRATNTKF